jgi:hypothetical protein
MFLGFTLGKAPSWAGIIKVRGLGQGGSTMAMFKYLTFVTSNAKVGALPK